MPAPVIAFDNAVAARREAGGVSIALLDGPASTVAASAEPACVGILLCSDVTARAMAAEVGRLFPKSEP